MDRAVLLPTPGDPFLLTYWLSLYTKIWGQEVDQLYICLNGQTDKRIIGFIYKIVRETENCWLIDMKKPIDHGGAIKELLKICKEKYVMLAEDDGFIFNAGKVEECFNKLESNEYDLIGSKRGSCSQEILDKAKKKWGIDYEGFGDQGCNFWPNFLFTHKKILLKTDQNFLAKRWEAGELIKGLGEKANNECVGDTLVNTSLQLRGMIPEKRIYYEPQFHGATDDEEDYIEHKNIWSPGANWLHVGSLSSGFMGLLDLNKELPKGDGFRTDSEKLELERRITFYSIFAENFTYSNIQKELHNYKKAIKRVIDTYGLSEARIDKRKSWYYEVLPKWI